MHMLTVNADNTINLRTATVDLQNYSLAQLAEWFDGRWDVIKRVRDELIESSRWVIERHRDQVALGITPTLSEAQYQAWLAYVQALRDLPQDYPDAMEIVWPLPPGDLA